MFHRKIVVFALVLVIWAPIHAYSASTVPPSRPLNYVQGQIENVRSQLEEFGGRFTPPAISYESSCNGASLNVDLSITDTSELSYYAIQEQGGNPSTNMIVFIEPG